MNAKQVKKSLYKSIRELGLTDQEINLYTISLSLGPSPISTLARHIAISRPNVYKLIDGLEKHGLARIYEKGKFSRKFVVEPPTIVLEKIREKKKKMAELDNEVASGLPELLAMYQQGQIPSKIKILQGKEQYINVYKKSLEESKGEIKYIGAAEEFINFVGMEFDLKWRKERIRKNIFMKILVLPSVVTEQTKVDDAKEKRETRVLEGNWPKEASFLIFANKVVVWQLKTPLSILIEDQYIVEMLKSMFDWMWERSA